MTTSGTYDFSLDNPSVIIEAFDRIGIRAPEITRSKMLSARRSSNLELQSWSVKGLNLWAISLGEVSLEDGVSEYDLDSETISILDAYISNASNDRIIASISRSDYAGIPNKTSEGTPTSFWFDRSSPTPTVKFWPVPDADSTYTFKFYYMRRLQDADATIGQDPDIPYRFMDAFIAGVAKRLAVKFAPSKYDLMKKEAEEAWVIATTEDREAVPISVAPDLSRYTV